VPRLRRLGVTEDEIKKLLEDNPRRVFEDSASGSST
jgi:predicted metal-dependent phosphotriesterase family hydrolase